MRWFATRIALGTGKEWVRPAANCRLAPKCNEGESPILMERLAVR
jgi:hypothetical protein